MKNTRSSGYHAKEKIIEKESLVLLEAFQARCKK